MKKLKTPAQRPRKAPSNQTGGTAWGKKLAAEFSRIVQSADMKKLILLNFPYIIAFYMVEKAAWLYRHCNGDSVVDRLMVLFMNFGLAYKSVLPSCHPFDLLIGLVGAAALKAVIYFKGKNAKKYRQGEEYGSARWGNQKDIEPFIDPVFENNVILTQTERLMMSGRPKHPKYARNKNVIVIGGSGSGKTRFYVKPNLMQMPQKVSYVVTDPKGTIIIECGKMLSDAGYKIKVLNTINFKKSMRYNPFHYIRSEKDILKLVNTIIAKWATRSRMKAGTQKISTTSLLGYDTDDDGEMVIVTNEAEIVRTIYMSFDKGMHPAEIAEKLNALEIRTIKNNPWTGESVKNILRNEKYCGDVLMQKTYTVDCLTHKTKKNEGEVEQYFIPDHHPAIVEREVWDKAQVRLEQIAGKRRRIRPKQQRLIPLRKGVLLGFVPIRPTWKAVSLKRLETATEKVMALVDAKPEQVHIEYESEECEMEILKGFEVINLKQPKGESVMTVTSNSLKFNKATAVELNYAPYIRVLLNAKTRQIAIQPCSEKDPNAIKFSNEESKQTYAISIKVPAIQVEFRRMLPFEDDNGGKLSYTLNGTLYPDEQVVIYDIGDVKPETEKKRRGRKKSEIEAEQKEN